MTSVIRIILRMAGMILLALIAGLGVNLYRINTGSGIAWVKDWGGALDVRAQELGIRILPLDEVRRLREEGMTLILDARPEDEYRQGRIPGAMNLPAHDLDAVLPDLMMMLFPEQPILVYCGGADCEDSLIAAQAIQEVGVLDVSIFKGGMREWRAHGLEEEGP